MRHTRFALALLAAAALAACGGGGSSGGDQSPKVQYTAQVTFGDSLSDVGTYAVGGVAALGGGKYTINGDGTATDAALTGKNWTELLAAQLGLPAPCPAQTGLVGDASQGFQVAIKNDPTCFGYAQGGARVTNPVGPGNKATGSPLGQMTVPVVTQIANHLAGSGGNFSGTELVNITVGGNDVAMQLGTLSANATAAGTAAGAAEGAKVGAQTYATTLVNLLASGATDPVSAAAAISLALQTEAARPGSTRTTQTAAAIAAAAAQPGNAAVAAPAVYGPLVAKAQSDAVAAGQAAATIAGAAAAEAYFTANAPAAVAAMTQAGTELVALVKNQVIAKGANYVVVNNLGDFANAPAGKSQTASVNALIVQMVDTFNATLKAGLAGESKALLIDLYAISHDQILNPAPYGLSNTADPACPHTPLGNSALVCTIQLVASGDVGHYMFADDRHPTPYEYRLIAQYVAEQMLIKGWL